MGVNRRIIRAKVVVYGPLVGLCIASVACGVHPPRDGGAQAGLSAPARSNAVVASSPNEYRIGPEDVLEVIVWKNAELSKVVTVRPDGMITLPLIGELRAGGLTADAVRDEIKLRLDRYKEVPEVSVTVSDVRSYNLYILGEVKTPGRYQVKSYTTLLQALALAGGFSPYAATNDIVVVRRDGATKEQRLRVKYKDLIRRGDFRLLPGDTVIVP